MFCVIETTRVRGREHGVFDAEDFVFDIRLHVTTN